MLHLILKLSTLQMVSGQHQHSTNLAQLTLNVLHLCIQLRLYESCLTKFVVETPCVRWHSLYLAKRIYLQCTKKLPASGFNNVISVRAVGSHCDVVPVDTKLAVVLVQRLEGGDVGRSLHHLVHPLYCSHHPVPGKRSHQDCRTNLSSWVKTGGPLCFVISSSVCTPTTSQPPIAFAWIVYVFKTSLSISGTPNATRTSWDVGTLRHMIIVAFVSLLRELSELLSTDVPVWVSLHGQSGACHICLCVNFGPTDIPVWES